MRGAKSIFGKTEGRLNQTKQNGEDARGTFTVSKDSDGKLSALLAARRAGVTAGELLDAAGGVDELLLAGEEGMAGRADADLQVPLGRTGVVDGAARASDRRLCV